MWLRRLRRAVPIAVAVWLISATAACSSAGELLPSVADAEQLSGGLATAQVEKYTADIDYSQIKQLDDDWEPSWCRIISGTENDGRYETAIKGSSALNVRWNGGADGQVYFEAIVFAEGGGDVAIQNVKVSLTDPDCTPLPRKDEGSPTVVNEVSLTPRVQYRLVRDDWSAYITFIQSGDSVVRIYDTNSTSKAAADRWANLAEQHLM